MPRLITLPVFEDSRGKLTPVEWEKIAPFEAKRLFFIHDVPPEARRGGHAHRTAYQLLVCAAGSVDVSIDDGSSTTVYTLKPDNRALLMQPRIWSEQYNFAPHTVLLVLTSEEYDPSEYIRDYDEFVAQAKKRL